MKNLKQIITEVQQYKCTEGSIEDCELRTLALRVNLIREMSDICMRHLENFDDINIALQYTDDFIYIAKLIEPFISDVQKKIHSGLGKNTINECLRTMTIAFKREELLGKYEGTDKKFVEEIIHEAEEHFNQQYGD